MKKLFYKSGDRVILKANKKEGWQEQHGFFVGLSAPKVAMVQVDPDDDLDDGLREVALSGIKPFYNHPSDQERRTKAAARMFRMGVRMFRLDKPDGRQFCVEAIDPDRGVACGHFFLLKTLKSVPLHSLWPNIVL